MIEEKECEVLYGLSQLVIEKYLIISMLTQSETHNKKNQEQKR